MIGQYNYWDDWKLELETLENNEEESAMLESETRFNNLINIVDGKS